MHTDLCNTLHGLPTYVTALVILLYKSSGMYNTFATPGLPDYIACESFDNVVRSIFLFDIILLCTSCVLTRLMLMYILTLTGLRCA